MPGTQPWVKFLGTHQSPPNKKVIGFTQFLCTYKTHTWSPLEALDSSDVGATVSFDCSSSSSTSPGRSRENSDGCSWAKWVGHQVATASFCLAPIRTGYPQKVHKQTRAHTHTHTGAPRRSWAHMSAEREREREKERETERESHVSQMDYRLQILTKQREIRLILQHYPRLPGCALFLDLQGRKSGHPSFLEKCLCLMFSFFSEALLGVSLKRK